MKVLGHRGTSRAARENTCAAFRLADEMGADGVELDVRLAADGRLLVHHDPLPDDPTELARIDELGDVLDACGRRMVVNVEIKNSDVDGGFDREMRVVDATLAELRRRIVDDDAAERWLISSFSRPTIDRCRERAPDIATAWLCSTIDGDGLADLRDGGHHAVHPWEGVVTAPLVAAAHAAGLALNTWTCNDPRRLRQLATFGVDAVCTDVPDVALAAIGR